MLAGVISENVAIKCRDNRNTGTKPYESHPPFLKTWVVLCNDQLWVMFAVTTTTNTVNGSNFPFWRNPLFSNFSYSICDKVNHSVGNEIMIDFHCSSI